MTKAKRRRAENASPLTKNLSLAALFLTVGIPLVTLVSMVSSYHEHTDQNSAEIIALKKQIEELRSNTGIHNADIEVFKESITDNSRDIDALKIAHNGYDEKILQVWKETASNQAQIESLKTEVLWLKSNQEREHR